MTAMADDDVLLRLFAETHSEQAFAQLVSRHIGLVYSAAARLLSGDSHRAEDVTQSVFIELARHAPHLKSHRSLTGWLYVTTRNVAIKWIRSEQRRKRREQVFEELRSSDPATGEKNYGERVSPFLDQAICDLNPPDREALLLRFFQGQPFAAIAAVQQVTEDGARMRVNRALEKLRRILEGRGLTSTASGLSLALSTHSIRSVPEPLHHVVAASALANSSSGASALASFLMSTTKAKIAVGAIVVGLGLLSWEHQALGWQTENLAELQESTASLQRRLGAESQRSGLAAAIPKPSMPNPAAGRTPAADVEQTHPSTPPTAQALAGITPEGVYSWEGKVGTVKAFIDDLAQFHKAHPEKTAQVLVNVQGCAGYQLAWLMNEARKQGVTVWLDSNSRAPAHQVETNSP